MTWGLLTQSCVWILLFLSMLGGGGIGTVRVTTLSPPSPASVIAERSATHTAQRKRLSAIERNPISTVFLFSLHSASRTKNPPRISWRWAHKRAITARQRDGGSPSPSFRVWGGVEGGGGGGEGGWDIVTRVELCVSFFFFFQSGSRSHFSFHPEHQVNQLYLEMSSLEVHWYGLAPWTGSHNNSGRSQRH